MTHATEHRFGETTLTFVDATGAPIPDAGITVEQTRHAFVRPDGGRLHGRSPIRARAQLERATRSL